ncbi:MAG: hypothetical protein J5501_03640 [Ruminococcus sp.]|nr:hypothetical protein [Ruminococcus sp.]
MGTVSGTFILMIVLLIAGVVLGGVFVKAAKEDKPLGLLILLAVLSFVMIFFTVGYLLGGVALLAAGILGGIYGVCIGASIVRRKS